MLTELDKRLIRLLQEDLPAGPRPYAVIGDQVGLSEAAVLDRIHDYLAKGYVRRFGAVLRHRKAGFTANAMVVWDVPAERAVAVGNLMAVFPEVSHCYERPRFPGWPFSHYTMLHGRTREECAAIAARIAAKTGVNHYRLLFSTAELKKTSMRYFYAED
ncbi:MAG: AsnC family transcriptional regulator [Heliobacteriaceae bacterium]|nr:AsnC family transcriptional regulator [Heliobacteriaceae bacterium]MDD4587408.1 AsnC family transcriptional regulator [Heliobacteriaceae bacterium]